MKKYFRIFAGILATAFIATGCQSYAQTGYNGGYYNPTYGYNYSDGYGDGQPNNGYYNNQQPNPNEVYQPSGQMPVGFNDFYNQLSPYGAWINMAPYGPVWVANVPNFQPYSTNGYWTYTNYGWTWVSNYSWGWAPFHYGRWGFNNRYGWYWVPGYTWGPAWVAWSSSADMFGWAPLMPGMNFGVSLSLSLFPPSYWTFMQGRYMGMNNIGNYYVNRSRNVTIIKNTTIINNYGTDSENNRRYTMGPNASDVKRYTGRDVQPMRVTNASDRNSTGVSNNELRVYRPVTRSNNTNNTSNTNNNRTGATPQTRTQPAQQPVQQPSNRTNNNTQTRNQPVQQPSSRAESPQVRSAQPATRQETNTYQQTPAQPKVTRSATPQTSRQIQAAQKENERTQQQQHSTTPSRSNTSNDRSRR